MDAEERERWLNARRDGVGASEAAAVVGLNPYRTALEVYFDKLGVLPRQESRRTQVGTLIEPVIARLYEAETGRTATAAQVHFVHPVWPWMMATVDYVTEGPGGERVLEVKRVGYGGARDWRNGPPVYYTLQVQQQLACMDFECGEIAALIGDDEFAIYSVARDDAQIATLAEAERKFMDAVRSETPPLPDFAHPSTEELLKLIRPVEEETVELPDECVKIADEYARLGETEGELKRRRAELKSRLVYAMGAAEIGFLADGRTVERSVRRVRGYAVQPREQIDFTIKRART